jgi:hypothetical protein
MSSSRARAALSVGSVCIFFLFLLLPQVSPAPVKAFWDPPIASGAPKDPGTPFEEPEGGNPGDTPNPAGRPGSLPGGRHLTPAASPAPGAAKIVVRQLVLQRLVLILWHLQ